MHFLFSGGDIRQNHDFDKKISATNSSIARGGFAVTR